MRKQFTEYVEQRRIDEVCWRVAYQLKRHNIHTEGFMEWFLEQDQENFNEENTFSNLLNAGWQGVKSGFSTGGKWGAGAGALGGTLAMPGVGTIAGAGLGGTFGGLGGALVGGIKGAWNQYNNPQNATAIQMNPLRQSVIQSFEKIKQIYSQHQNGKQIAANLDKVAEYLNKLK